MFSIIQEHCVTEKQYTYSEMESSHFCIDWRKKVVIQATLKPACMNRVDVFFDAIEKRPVFKPIIAKREWVFENDRMQVVINTSTGLVDSWKVDGEEYLKKDSFQLTARGRYL